MTRAGETVRAGAPLARGVARTPSLKRPPMRGPLLVALALALDPRSSAAADPELPDAGGTFEYSSPAEKHYLRAALEQVGVLGVGLAHYFANRDANSVDWDLDYDWQSFRKKLVGDAYAFDTNLFDTNFLTHPGSGTLYYLAARGNRLSVLESLGYAFASSTVWELFGEFREQVSVNDLVVTPLAGLTIGEASTQLGAFFDRSCPTAANRVLGSALGPSKSLHDAIDGKEPRRESVCDRFGLSASGGHRFRFSAASAAVFSDAGPGASGETSLAVSAETRSLRSLGRPGRGWHSFSDGNVASLSGTVGFERRNVSNVEIRARSVPAGLHWRNLSALPGFGLRGSEVLLGVLFGSEYAQHRYERPSGKIDRVFVIDAPATTATLVVRRGSQRLEVGLDAGVAFGGIDSFALAEFRRTRSDPSLPTVTSVRGYSHAAGFSLSPSVRLSLDGAELGFDGRADRLYGLRAGTLDRTSSVDPHDAVAEVRRRGRLWLSIGPPGALPRVTLFADGRQRSGTVRDVERTRLELALGASADATF